MSGSKFLVEDSETDDPLPAATLVMTVARNALRESGPLSTPKRIISELGPEASLAR